MNAATHVVQRAVGADRTTFLQITHLANDCSNTARTEASSAAADEARERTEELTLCQCGLEREEVAEDANDHEKLFGRVALHERQEGCVERIRNFELVGVLTEEKHTLVDQVANDETKDLA